MKRAIQHTSSAAVLAVGAGLSRRGYDVTLTMGNTPKIDMMCAVPNLPAFKIQVKGISNRAAFFVGEKFFEGNPQSDLFLVVVYVPKIETEEPMEFYILKHEQAQSEFQSLPQKRKDGQDFKAGTSGLTWKSISDYKDNWEAFPSINRESSDTGETK